MIVNNYDVKKPILFKTTIQLLIGLLFLTACTNNQTKTKTHFAFISHTRLDDNSGINSVVSKADLKKYNLLLLGGDLANLSSVDKDIMDYLNTIFDLQNTTTLWALGNHDYSDLQLIEKYTLRKNYYAHYQFATTFLVLDTQLDSSRISGDQLDFFKSVTDTLDHTKNVILLTHKLIWMYNHAELEKQIETVSNGPMGSCDYCLQPNNFYTAIYPELVRLQQKGIAVYCLAGDIGFQTKTFSFKTAEGVTFYANGINKNEAENYFLHITVTDDEQLQFEFMPLEKL